MATAGRAALVFGALLALVLFVGLPTSGNNEHKKPKPVQTVEVPPTPAVPESPPPAIDTSTTTTLPTTPLATTNIDNIVTQTNPEVQTIPEVKVQTQEVTQTENTNTPNNNIDIQQQNEQHLLRQHQRAQELRLKREAEARARNLQNTPQTQAEVAKPATPTTHDTASHVRHSHDTAIDIHTSSTADAVASGSVVYGAGAINKNDFPHKDCCGRNCSFHLVGGYYRAPADPNLCHQLGTSSCVYVNWGELSDARRTIMTFARQLPWSAVHCAAAHDEIRTSSWFYNDKIPCDKYIKWWDEVEKMFIKYRNSATAPSKREGLLFQEAGFLVYDYTGMIQLTPTDAHQNLVDCWNYLSFQKVNNDHDALLTKYQKSPVPPWHANAAAGTDDK